MQNLKDFSFEKMQPLRTRAIEILKEKQKQEAERKRAEEEAYQNKLIEKVEKDIVLGIKKSFLNGDEWFLYEFQKDEIYRQAREPEFNQRLCSKIIKEMSGEKFIVCKPFFREYEMPGHYSTHRGIEINFLT